MQQKKEAEEFMKKQRDIQLKQQDISGKQTGIIQSEKLRQAFNSVSNLKRNL